jgi:hypothetical protein
LILGIAIGAVVVWYLRSTPREHSVERAGTELRDTVRSAGNSIREEVRSWDLDTDKIRDEMARTGKVIRKKAEAAGAAISDATADARITTAVKAKLVKDPALSAWTITVNTTDGTVTLSGSVESAEQVASAIALAMDTDGVREVISALQIKAPKP